jgi:hypothetical protein
MFKMIKNLELLESKISAFLEDITEPLPPNKVMENPNFRKWFGDSVTVNSDGTPMVFFHGTSSQLSEFDSEFLGNDASKVGFWFTNSADRAEMYADFRGESPSIIPVYLKLFNPYILSAQEWLDLIRNNLGSDNWFKSLRNKLIMQGHDGIHVKGELEYFAGVKMPVIDILSVFNANQIKSIYNNGQFSTTSNNISESNYK